MANFDSNGRYNKTYWETGDKITKNKLNKIEEGIEKINNDLINTKDDLEDLENELNNKNYATEDFVIDKIEDAKLEGSDVDLSNYAKKTEIPTKTSQLINDSNYLTSIPNEYVTENELNNKGYASETFVINKIAEAQVDSSDGNIDLSGYATKDDLNGKVDKINGKGLSTEDYTSNEKEKLSNIEENANNYIHPQKHNVSIIDGLSNVATSGNYNDLTNKPTIPSISGLATETFVTNKINEAKFENSSVDLSILNNKIDCINIINYSHLVTNNDWTQAIAQAISDATSGSTIFFPKGEYNHKGIIITKPINIVGDNKYSTKLINVGTGDSIKINENIERGSFRHIAIFGNGTYANPSLATAKRGVVFSNNSVVWRFDDIWMRCHGDYFFYADDCGHVNNIIIQNSELEAGATGCIRLYQNHAGAQINAIYIQNCNISGFETNGIEVWGQNIVISNNTIQACKKVGISIEADNSQSSLLYSNNSHAKGIYITGNYFELCYLGCIKVKANVKNSVARGIQGCSIIGNYGTYVGVPSTVDKTKVAMVTVDSGYGYSDSTYYYYVFAEFLYLSNSFGKDGADAIFQGNGYLPKSCIVQVGKIGSTKYNNPNYTEDYKGLSSATILGSAHNNKKYFIPKNNGLDVDLNNNLTFGEKYNISIPHPLNEMYSFTITAETDSTDVTVYMYDYDTGVAYRNIKATIANKVATFTYAGQLRDNSGELITAALSLKFVSSSGTYIKVKEISYLK